VKAIPEIAKSFSTEEKIKEAARKVFTQKGYAATRTRDIAEEAGLNLALLNYYFRSKEKLFDIIMTETFQVFMQSIVEIINDEQTTMNEKIEKMVSRYIDTLTIHPDIPLFIISEIKADPKKFMSKTGMSQHFQNSFLKKQMMELAMANKTPLINPLHIMLNMMSLTIFPFVANPIIQNIGGLSKEQFNEMMQERKKLIPIWISSMIAPTGYSADKKQD